MGSGDIQRLDPFKDGGIPFAVYQQIQNLFIGQQSILRPNLFLQFGVHFLDGLILLEKGIRQIHKLLQYRIFLSLGISLFQHLQTGGDSLGIHLILVIEVFFQISVIAVSLVVFFRADAAQTRRRAI